MIPLGKERKGKALIADLDMEHIVVHRKPILPDFSGKRILMLQGPMGPFFRRLAKDLEDVGARVYKVNFNGGDFIFFMRSHLNYKGDIKHWPRILNNLIVELNIDVVMLYGDLRPVHLPVQEISRKYNIGVIVFEEGYLRPDYITIEIGGANGFSKLKTDFSHYIGINNYNYNPVGYSFFHQALYASIYHVSATFLRFMFSNDNYHRNLGISEAIPQIISYIKKFKNIILERKFRKEMNRLGGDYFLVPLQVATDSQVLVHSHYGKMKHGIKSFIEDVIMSFSKNAKLDKYLVFKHHPLDRGYNDYKLWIKRLSMKYNVSDRVYYIYDLKLPELIDNSCGVVVINSTVGLSALLHGKPVKACGMAVYDMPGMTAQVSLDAFWKRYREFYPEKSILNEYISYIICTRLINGNFYKRLKGSSLESGLIWD